METFIAFFDILGFKEIIKNNDLGEVKRFFDNLLRDTQSAVSEGKHVQMNEREIAPDLKQQKVNCLHVSDSIVFWTNSNTENDFKELADVCYSFYSRSLQTTFPLRGCLTYGEIDFNPDTIGHEHSAKFYNYSLFGKGLVDAYLKAESIEYVGCLLDKLAIEKVDKSLIDNLINEGKVCEYKVPFKTEARDESVFRPIKGSHNDTSFKNSVDGIKRLFTYASKTDIDKMPESVKNKMNNTIDFISTFKKTDKESN